jgi:cell division protease FtsH
MDGRDPRPPAGWDDDSEEPRSPDGGATVAAKDGESKDKPIGGPAGQH